MKKIFHRAKQKNNQKIKKFKERSLARKLIAAVVVIIIIQVSALGLGAYFYSVDALETELKASGGQMIGEVENYVDEYFVKYENSLDLISKDPNLLSLGVEETEDIVELEEGEESPGIELEESNSEEKAIKTFERYMNSYDDVINVYLANPDKAMNIYPEVDLGDDYDPTTRAWYIDAEDQGGLVWSDPYLNDTTNEMNITLSTPIYDGDKFVGILGIDILLTSVSESLNEIEFGEYGEVILVDNKNNIMTHSEERFIGEPMPSEEIMDAISSEKEGVVHYTKEENGVMEEKFTNFTTIDRLDWKILGTSYMKEIRESVDGVIYSILIIGLIVLVLGIVGTIIFSKILIKPLKNLVEDMKKVEAGDFTVKSEVKTNDEIGALSKTFNMMIESVNSLIKSSRNVSSKVISSSQDLAATSQETSASAEEVSRTIEEIAKGASEQASDAEDGAKMVGNLGNKINSLVKNSDEIINNTKNMMDANMEGIKAVETLKEENKESEKSTNNIETAVLDLSDKSKDIGNILKTITSIAEQTNLLALNASIEAARAGEHGRGFAVVANEIRQLAEGSGKAAEEIKDIVTGIQDKSKNTVNVMSEVKESSIRQGKSVNKVNDSFTGISTKIDEIATKIENMNEFITGIDKDKNALIDSIENISSVSEETAAASEEVSASVQQQTSAVEQVAVLADDLNGLADELNKEMEKFNI